MQASFQDGGRQGFQYLGIGAGGCMDLLAFTLANLLAGNPPKTAVLEMAFPAPALYFENSVDVVLTGADFGAMCEGIELPLYRLIHLPAKSTIVFHQKKQGQWSYISVAGGWRLPKVLGSYATHIKGGFGGFKGRALQKEDEIKELQKLPVSDKPAIEKSTNSVQPEEEINFSMANWYINPAEWYLGHYIRAIPGPEWEWLAADTQLQLQQSFFTIGNHSDRMALTLESLPLEVLHKQEMLSSGVLRGTIQCLPNGQLLMLMADHQTTGGYPRVLQVAAVDLPKLAQMVPGEGIKFAIISVEEAQELLQEQEGWVQQVGVGIGMKRMG